MSPTQVKSAVAAYHSQAKLIPTAVFINNGTTTTVQLQTKQGRATIYQCATLVGQGASLQILSDGRYAPQNLMLGNLWGPCSRQPAK